MNRDEIDRRLEQIRHAAADGDYEMAHGLEDALHKDALSHIATHHHDGANDPATCPACLASRVLESSAYDFARWCA